MRGLRPDSRLTTHVSRLLALLLSGCESPECEQTSCSADASQLDLCQDGKLETISCAERGQLCEAGACVDPWKFGSPAFSTCEGWPRATSESLQAKAEYYDDIAVRLHLHPDLGFIQNVVLMDGVSEATATHEDVARFLTGENDGLWSALYLASQAYRYAVTESPEALQTIRTMLAAEAVRMRITGVPGIFTRQYIPPNVPGIACPSEDAEYTTDVEKDDNRWVQIREDGCVWVVANETGAWTKSDHCGLGEFAGWCWLDNVSKDEYSGHLFALGALAKLVAVDDVQDQVKDMLRQIGEHLRSRKMRLIDWDGRRTEHGSFLPFVFDDFPGFNAAMGMELVAIAAEATGDAELRAFYDDCLLQKSGTVDCLESGLVNIEPYTVFLDSPGMYLGDEGCRSNYNNISMHMLSMHHLIWFETNPRVRAEIQRSFDEDVVRAEGQPRAVLHQNNAFFDFMWAAQKNLGPLSDGPAHDAVENGVCMLREFRASQSIPDVVLGPEHVPYCLNRFDRDVGGIARSPSERCPATFLWWGDPYGLGTCARDDRQIYQPSSYLLPYWMGRFYGFIGDQL